MPKPYTHYDIGMQQVQTLGQKLSNKEKGLADYACNIYAVQIADLDLLISRLEKISKYTRDVDARLRNETRISALKSVREELVIKGTAEFLKKADILTQLSVRVGKTGSRDPLSGSR